MSNEKLECADCGHVYTESSAKMVPYPDCIGANYHACPECESIDVYLYEDDNNE